MRHADVKVGEEYAYSEYQSSSLRYRVKVLETGIPKNVRKSDGYGKRATKVVRVAFMTERYGVPAGDEKEIEARYLHNTWVEHEKIQAAQKKLAEQRAADMARRKENEAWAMEEIVKVVGEAHRELASHTVRWGGIDRVLQLVEAAQAMATPPVENVFLSLVEETDEVLG
jgi:hypothetical protein